MKKLFEKPLTIIFYLMLATVLFSCSNDRVQKKYTLYISKGTGMSYGSSVIACDSFEMKSTKECIFWNNGTKQIIFSQNDILPNNVSDF